MSVYFIRVTDGMKQQLMPIVAPSFVFAIMDALGKCAGTEWSVLDSAASD